MTKTPNKLIENKIRKIVRKVMSESFFSIKDDLLSGFTFEELIEQIQANVDKNENYRRPIRI